MQIVPFPQILSYRYKKERPMVFKIRQNPFSVFADDAPPDPLVGCGTDTPSHTPPTRHQPIFGASHASPQNSSQIYAYAVEANVVHIRILARIGIRIQIWITTKINGTSLSKDVSPI